MELAGLFIGHGKRRYTYTPSTRVKQVVETIAQDWSIVWSESGTQPRGVDRATMLLVARYAGPADRIVIAWLADRSTVRSKGCA